MSSSNNNGRDNLTAQLANHLKLSDGLFVHDKQDKFITFGGKATFDTDKVKLETKAGGLIVRELSYKGKMYSPKATAIINLAIDYLRPKDLAEDVAATWQPNWKLVDYKDLPFQGETRKLARSIVNQLAKVQDSFAPAKITEKAFDTSWDGVKKVRGLHGDVKTLAETIKGDKAEYNIRVKRAAKVRVEKVVTPLSTAQGNVLRLRSGIASLKTFSPDSPTIAELEAKLEVAIAEVAKLKAEAGK